jgi:hypothetical protein
MLKAADVRTGRILWQFQTGSGVVAPPVTWEEDGAQQRRQTGRSDPHSMFQLRISRRMLPDPWPTTAAQIAVCTPGGSLC